MKGDRDSCCVTQKKSAMWKKVINTQVMLTLLLLFDIIMGDRDNCMTQVKEMIWNNITNKSLFIMLKNKTLT